MQGWRKARANMKDNGGKLRISAACEKDRKQRVQDSLDPRAPLTAFTAGFSEPTVRATPRVSRCVGCCVRTSVTPALSRFMGLGGRRS